MGQNKEMARKLFKLDANDDIITLNPYEMHKKIRYYESKLEIM